MKAIVVAGGTGGHIYPALAIINKIKEKEEDCISPEDAATLDEFYKTVFKKSE